MSKSQRLRESDVRAMLRLMGELGELPHDPTTRMRHALVGLGKLVHAKAVFYTRFRSYDPRKQVEPYAMLAHGFTPAQQAGVIATGERDPIHDYVIRDMHEQREWPFVLLRQRLSPERKRARSEVAEEIRNAVGSDMDAIIITPATQAGHFAGLALQRTCEDRTRFSAREVRMAALVWNALRSLHRAPAVMVDERLWGAELPPRLQQVLQRLLVGDSAKQVARRLNLSVHTVNDYTKELHRRFGVSSRAELLALFIRREGP